MSKGRDSIEKKERGATYCIKSGNSEITISNYKEDFSKILKGKTKKIEEWKRSFNFSKRSERYLNKKHYNVLFSGGYDSTALVLEHLQKGDVVIPFFITFDEPSYYIAQITIEILRYFPKNLSPLRPLFSPIAGTGYEELGFTQQSFSAFFASKISKDYLENCIATEIAYCMNDDALSYLDELKALYNSGLETCFHSYRPPIQFPMIKKTHFQNSESVLDWEYQHLMLLSVTNADGGDLFIEGQTDAKGNIGIKVEIFTSKEYENKPNKKVREPEKNYTIFLRGV